MKTFLYTSIILLSLSLIIVISIGFCHLWDIQFNLIIAKIGGTLVLLSVVSFLIALILTYKD